MPLPFLIAGALRSGSEGNYNPFSGLRSLWQDITGVTASNNAADALREGNEAAAAALSGALDPYANAGTEALEARQALAGLRGPEAQAEALAMLESSPQFASMVQQGEQGILANASATGGLRGGNTQGALAQFRPQMLSQMIQNRMANLGGIAGQGLAAAQQLGSGLSGLASQGGQNAAANILGNYNLQRGFITDIANAGINIAGMAGGLPPMGQVFGGSGGGQTPMMRQVPRSGYGPGPVAF